ncbi:hypothetical protein FHT39_003895 [Mitsuaria sp. BK045]|uniref:hypothetical protein n=1 Tax=unclassified Roseateles TaxID=2626991 RepID=UPI00161A0232|nr:MULTISPECIES: hypothetical protein [unclassified Roseateles]MBB3295215.1 hypothetical protein [Mitsuaria sp. BK041]MBB3364431.1 hypothetical protein [Mitsuaria sp. BK045]
MPFLRWILVAAVLTGAATLVAFGLHPADDDRVALADPSSTAASAGLTASSASPPQAFPPFSPDASGPPAAGTTRPAAIGPAVGASAVIEDYGQIVLAALQGGSAAQAGDATEVLSRCEGATQVRETLETVRADPKSNPADVAHAIAHFDDRVRRCQSITDEMRAQRLPLAERALRGGERGVSMAYFRLVDFDPPQDMRAPLLEGLRGDVRAGDRFPTLVLATRGEDLGLSPVEARAYALLAEDLNPQLIAPGKFSRNREQERLTDAQLRQAAELKEQYKREMKRPRTGRRVGRSG